VTESVLPSPAFNEQVKETVIAELRRRSGGAGSDVKPNSVIPYIRLTGFLAEDLDAAADEKDDFDTLPSALMDLYWPDSDGKLVEDGNSQQVEIFNRYTTRSAGTGSFVEAEFKGGRWFGVELCDGAGSSSS